MMRQYRELKRRYPDYLLLFRLGDFYETFFEDAETAARLLQITLTSRQGAPMAGIPHHAADGHIAKLVRAGRKIAVSEQLEAPGRTRKLLRRDVVRVITPGTLTDTAYLAGAANNFLLALAPGRGVLGVALVDVSTGEFWAGEDGAEDVGVLAAALLRRPAEVLLPEPLRADTALLERLGALGIALTFCEPAAFAGRRAAAELAAHFRVESLDAFGVGDMTVGLQAAAGALGYLRATQGQALGHLTHLARLSSADAMVLDETAVATLELLEASDGSARNSLFGVLDGSVTPMGARLLRQWLLRPLTDPAAIGERQDAVEALVAAPAARARLRALLGRVGDLERLTSRATLGVAHARDLVGLRTCLAPLADVRAACAGLATPLLGQARAELADLDDLRALLAQALTDEPPLTLHDGGLIREGWHEGLAALVRDAREAREWIAGLEGRERARTGIASLRVRFNRVFGYGIEVTHAHTGRVPAEYVRRQTLSGAERYVTEALKAYEARVLGADERRRRLELELFEDVRRRVAARAPELLATARALARLDTLAALAEVAHARGHVRPVVDRSDVLAIVEGRHPVLEARSGAPVTPNDLALDAEARIVILTGPNMAGKSVYLRQTGHIAILAQMGAFVPAREARLGVLDRIFTRVGAQDNLARGQSTFLVEMVETAAILNGVSARSLVLLDEVGRGTSTFDGLAIAWAVVERLHDAAPGAKVLFATHFHELTRLAGRFPAVRNFHVAVREWNDEIIFLHKVQPGGTDRSYGVQVARLAGLPAPVIARAKALLAELEEAGQLRTDVRDAEQLGLFAPPAAPDPALTELLALDLAHLTPIEALNLLVKWQRVHGTP
ncbi:MAG: DNA mismatch repair protein MutS [Candidatus Rokubacteria bacterium RIFCSPHIGHO2_12_FULL_73_22]|nr:MAG: DNA mismatch repair protein MutS [Candidatus Rokubacteria bacterium RIFCSPHIGHO2_02_FULL_73_26]OGL00265.1 MAG: DNA mismatch repair protein MutS [Candidatus Rokubacteria bacterium RIFCSPHIGHO2_12_FULL_73_22]OGL09590.1 MAG: DNA mismatch repair protein MutS [Candidatus Rokubacteria bacterium RIFCSPLOWO2_02_FULL_73_56]OGL26706.1 MAG: DNA mismatch repair protein MutS [Candidatus Rokubacteria bacterium RIFCSPLOWO2_12_FULL_73_47]